MSDIRVSHSKSMMDIYYLSFDVTSGSEITP